MRLLALATTDLIRDAGGVIWLALWLAAMVRIGLVAARMYQIEEYEGRRLIEWSNVRAWNWHRALVLSTLIALIFGGAAILVNSVWTAAEGVAAALVLQKLWRWTPPKKALVWTDRMRRLFIASSVVVTAFAAGALVAVLLDSRPWGPFLVWLSFALATTIPVFALVAGNAVMAPYEARVRRGFVRAATARMAVVAPAVVAVAGSWGKTSTKHILAALLPDEAVAMPTPKSFNTLMGVSKTVNNDLRDDTRTFIVEMDAYAVGEIAVICDIVHPRFAVVTAVGPQHLERFGSVERIGDALYECIAALPEDGVAVVHGGDERCASLATRARKEGRRAVTYAAQSEAVEADVQAVDVTLTPEGSRFTFSWAAEKISLPVEVPLLGAHQILNVTAALIVTHLLGYDVAAAAARVPHLEPVEHRLQPLPNGNGVTVIDDSYNANPVGVHNGLDVLASLGDGQKVLVTPGLVELGSAEVAENRRYGEHAAKVCDQVIVMRAKTSDALLAGLRDGGLAEESIHLVATLDEATAVIGKVTKRGDVVLFANDLPDTYL